MNDTNLETLWNSRIKEFEVDPTWKDHPIYQTDEYKEYRKNWEKVSKGEMTAPFPLNIEVEPTYYCNLKCPLCPSGNGEMSRRRGNMSIDDFKKMVDELAPKSFMMMMWNQGEPYLNGCFNEMVRYAHDKGIFTFTSTNGHYIRKDSEAESIVKSGLDEIIVSLDGVDQETYQQYRVGGDINKVFDGVKRLVVAKKQLGLETPFINLQFIVMRHNQQDIKHADTTGQIRSAEVKSGQIK